MASRPPEPDLPNNIRERDWRLLLKRIKDGKCTPIIGPDVYEPVRAFQEAVAQEWADESRYASRKSEELARVAQFLALEYDLMYPKEEFVNRLSQIDKPNFDDRNEPYYVLAQLPFSVYMTTVCDDFILQSLRNDRMRDPQPMLCQWNKTAVDVPANFVSELGKRPTAANPLVFFCHGHMQVPESLVLTEDDHLAFLVRAARLEETLPARIVEALANESLMLIGFRPADWCFRVLFQGLLPSLARREERTSVAVQLLEEDRHSQEYLAAYFESMNVRIFWGSPREFTAELYRRWQESRQVSIGPAFPSQPF
jgi:hypothetical protein